MDNPLMSAFVTHVPGACLLGLLLRLKIHHIGLQLHRLHHAICST